MHLTDLPAIPSLSRQSSLAAGTASGRDPDVVAVRVDEAEAGLLQGRAARGAVGHCCIPRRGENRVDVVYLS